jgi:hypothetical protein
MKKLLGIVLVIGLLTIGSHNSTVNAKDLNDEQASDHFLLSLLSDEIQKAVADYYKDEVGRGAHNGVPTSIFIKYGHDNKKHAVEVFQSEKGHELESSFVVKVNITPQKKGELGRDTITFGIEPDKISIKTLDYKHSPIKN